MTIEVKDWPVEDLEAILKFRDGMIPKAYEEDWLTGEPLWKESAIMEAFLEGIKYAREKLS